MEARHTPYVDRRDLLGLGFSDMQTWNCATVITMSCLFNFDHLDKPTAT